jgi:hypothetical protein
MISEEAPIFIVGTGRSGTTILYSCMAMHPALGWVSSWVGVAPRLPLAAFNRFWSLPGTDRFREARFFPRPAEPMRVFPRLLSLYKREAIDAESLEEAQRVLVPLVTRLRRLQGKPRFLTKMAGRPVKSELLATVFPNAFIINITRDLKPTVASLLQVSFYDTSIGLDSWPWGKIPETYLQFFDRSGRDVAVAAAIKIKLNRIEQERQLARIPAARWCEIKYSTFVDNPIDNLVEIGGKAGLKTDDRFLARVRRRKIYGGADKKWMKYFTPEQVRLLDQFESLPPVGPVAP